MRCGFVSNLQQVG
uniref:Uncharacterized protein n=1 Tax=Arundo donax TaxID=35708 RepID=A0A0A9BGK8_ARUDO